MKFGHRSLYRIFRFAIDTGGQDPAAELPVDQPRLHVQLRDDRALSHSRRVPADRRSAAATLFGPAVHDEPIVLFESVHVMKRKAASRSRRAHQPTARLVDHMEPRSSIGLPAIVLDIITFPDARIRQELYLDRLRAEEVASTSGRLVRFELSSRGDGPPSVRPLAEVPIELLHQLLGGRPAGRIVSLGARATRVGRFLKPAGQGRCHNA